MESSSLLIFGFTVVVVITAAAAPIAVAIDVLERWRKQRAIEGLVGVIEKREKVVQKTDSYGEKLGLLSPR